jgi:RNA polymerase sigma-70 factor (ECF subfamily)
MTTTTDAAASTSPAGAGPAGLSAGDAEDFVWVAPSWDEVVRTHADRVYRLAYRLSGNRADAEDLTQETFGKALSRLGQLREPDRAKAWLFRILRNAYLHRVRDERRHKLVSLDAVGELPCQPAETLPDVDPSKLQEALNELDETFRTPLILFYFEEFSYRDIAEQMDLPIGTVMSRLARAKAYLRVKLTPGGHDGRHPGGGEP